MKFIDLFCGAGLFSEGMKKAGHTPILGIDNWKLACRSYETNHCETICEDIQHLDIDNLPKVDLIIGSPPCQDFSLMNNKRQENPVLIYKFLEIIGTLKPKFWIMEEVPRVRKYLPRNIRYYLLDACNFGANQKRRRMFAGKFKAVLVPKLQKHKIPGLSGNRTNYKARDSKRVEKRRIGKYFNYRQPTIGDYKYEFGLNENYVLFGNKQEQIQQVVNGVYVPLAKTLGEAIYNHGGTMQETK